LRIKRIAFHFAGAVLVLLGTLWFLQGADIIRIDPVLCVAKCEPIAGPQPAWLATGLVAFFVGALLIAVGIISKRPN
jgi:hypothetical protein